MNDIAPQLSIREGMPLLARNEGVWEGWYRYYSAATGKLVDQHRSRLMCRLLDEVPYAGAYHQDNFYFWEDGCTGPRVSVALRERPHLVR